jgi:outer membrane PBP1 activator LpoA protein
MSKKIIGRWVLIAAAVFGLNACTSIDLNEPAPVVDSVPAKPVHSAPVVEAAQPPQTAAEPEPEQQPLEPNDAIVTEAVGIPDVAAAQPSLRIALLLPGRMLVQVSDAVRAGFMAAHALQPDNVVVNVIDTSDAPNDVLAGYQQAVQDNDIVVGPLTRSGAVAIVQEHAVVKPTIALTQLNAVGEPEIATPSNMLPIGLSLEDEARQIANWIGKKGASAFVVSTSAAWQRRVAGAFAMQWRSRGLEADLLQLSLTDGYLDAEGLLQLKKRLQSEKPSLLFVALDAAQAAQLRNAIGNEVEMVGTSQLNPLTLESWPGAEPIMPLNGVRLVDIPWQLQADHTAVMAYPRQTQGGEQRRNADLERLYALGIDAYRVARNVAAQQTDFKLDGVTGNLNIHFGQGAPKFERSEQPAVYRDGKVQLLNAQ